LYDIITTFVTEWICRIYYEKAVLNENINEIEENIVYYYEFLLKLNINSEIASIAKAVHLKNRDELVSSRECLNQVIILNAQSFYAWLILSQVYCKLYCWEETENASRQALQLIKPYLKDRLYYGIKLRLLEAMSRSNNSEKLIQTQQMCEEVSLTYII